MMDVHFSSATDLWSTPQDYFDGIAREFNFVLDVCATDENTKCEHWFTKERCGLAHSWHGFNGDIWMNPPYGRGIGDWVKKAYETATQGTTVVCLLPARTDTKWWHDYAMKGEIRFLKGRLKFGGAKNNAPFPSALVIFRKQNHYSKWQPLQGSS